MQRQGSNVDQKRPIVTVKVRSVKEIASRDLMRRTETTVMLFCRNISNFPSGPIDARKGEQENGKWTNQQNEKEIRG